MRPLVGFIQTKEKMEMRTFERSPSTSLDDDFKLAFGLKLGRRRVFQGFLSGADSLEEKVCGYRGGLSFWSLASKHDVFPLLVVV